VKETPLQLPAKWAYKEHGDIVIARNPVVRPVPLPDELEHAMTSSLVSLREGAVAELGRLLSGSHPGLSLAAHQALVQLADDDSRRVAAAARQILADHAGQEARDTGAAANARGLVAAWTEPAQPEVERAKEQRERTQSATQGREVTQPPEGQPTNGAVEHQPAERPPQGPAATWSGQRNGLDHDAETPSRPGGVPPSEMPAVPPTAPREALPAVGELPGDKGRHFARWWTLLHALGWSAPLYFVLREDVYEWYIGLLDLPVSVIGGAVVGIGQWALLRTYLVKHGVGEQSRDTAVWVASTIANSYLIFHVLKNLLFRWQLSILGSDFEFADSYVVAALAASLAGAAPALAQWAILRRFSPLPQQWVLASVAGVGLGGTVFGLLSWLFDQALVEPSGSAIVLATAMAGLLYGWFPGLTLARLIRGEQAVQEPSLTPSGLGPSGPPGLQSGAPLWMPAWLARWRRLEIATAASVVVLSFLLSRNEYYTFGETLRRVAVQAVACGLVGALCGGVGYHMFRLDPLELAEHVTLGSLGAVLGGLLLSFAKSLIEPLEYFFSPPIGGDIWGETALTFFSVGPQDWVVFALAGFALIRVLVGFHSVLSLLRQP
jgi:hypothetical protein